MTRHFTLDSYNSSFCSMLDFRCEEDPCLSVVVKIHKDMFIYLHFFRRGEKQNEYILTQEELEAIKNDVKELAKSLNINIDISTLPWITNREDLKEKCEELKKEAEARIIKAANDYYDFKDMLLLFGYHR